MVLSSSQYFSVVFNCSQKFSVVLIGFRSSHAVVLRGSHAVVLRGSHVVVLSGSQWFQVVFSGSKWFQVVLSGSQVLSSS